MSQPIEPNIISKYDAKGPRYTSYPTALQFSDAFTAKDYIAEVERLNRQAQSIAPLSLYIHIPFCHNVCYYCACNKIISRDHTQADTYLSYLQKEILLTLLLRMICQCPVKGNET